jgi:LysR family transcriptional regulator, regulator for metE and metH
MALESRDLRTVLEIARTGSVTRAADRLNVTQSALSHQLREIEHRLGTALFLRAGRRMQPTAAGQALVDAAEKIVGELTRVEAAVGRLVRHEAGELRVATQCHTGYHWLPGVLEAARKKYPGHAIRILAEHTAHPMRALLEGRLDLAIVNDAPNDRRVRLQPLFHDEHAAIVWPEHPWARRAYVSADQLAAERLLLYSRSLDDSFIVRHVLRPAGLEPAQVTFIQLTEALLEMVKARAGVSVLPTWSVAPALADGAVVKVRITRGGVFRPWMAAALAAAPPSPFMDFFVGLLVSQGRSLARVGTRA